jgi:serine protease AprX
MAKNILKLLPLFLVLVLALLGMTWMVSTTDPASAAPVWQTKVDENLLEQFTSGELEFIVYMAEQADLSHAAALSTKEEKGNFVFSTLRETSQRTQKSFLSELNSKNIVHRSFWVANMIWVKGDFDILQAAAQREDVAYIYSNKEISLAPPEVGFASQVLLEPAGIEWNIALVNAHKVWEAGFTGQGVVIGGQDTGYDWDHPALIQQYRGWNLSGADHNFNWHDAIHESLQSGTSANPCGYASPEPCDDNNHGTHTMGTMVGQDNLGNQIGMAPGAQWIGCRNMDSGWGTPATYSECFEWFLAPYPYGGSSEEGDASKAPHVINNSWGCPPAEGCTTPDILKTVVENTRAAGIVVVASAGNSGPVCSTVSTPLAIYESVFSIGATDSSDRIAGFSSRGPVTVDSSGRAKPDVTAPGVGIRSSLVGGGYSGQSWSGTSMASPHVAGLVALLISANPSLAGQVDQIEEIIRRSAIPLSASQSCGEVDPGAVPNYTYGWGRIDAWEAFNLLPSLSLTKTASPSTTAPGEIITYTLNLQHYSPTSTTSVVIIDRLPEGTLFVSATEPYRLEDDRVFWEFDQLFPGDNPQVELVVTTPLTIPHGHIYNQEYLAFSAEVSTPVSGPPVPVFVGYRGELLFGPDTETAVFPGSYHVVSHTLTNLGNVVGTVSFSAVNSRAWEISSIPNISLNPGESKEVYLSITVPASEPFFTEVYTVIEAVLQEDEAVFTRVATKMIVTPHQQYLPAIVRNRR